MRIINEPDGTISSASNRNIHKLEWRGNSGWWGTLKMHTVQFDLSVIKEDWVQCHHIPPQHRKAVVQLMSGPHCLAYRWLSNNWWDFYAPLFFFFLFVFCYGDWNIKFRLFSLMKLHLSAAHQRLTLTWGTVQVFAQACENCMMRSLKVDLGNNSLSNMKTWLLLPGILFGPWMTFLYIQLAFLKVMIH